MGCFSRPEASQISPRKIASLAGNPDLRQRLGAAAHQNVLREYTVERMAAGFREAIEYAVQKRRAG
jgi:hypothetical protein